MHLRDIYGAIGEQAWLDRIADGLQPAVGGFFDGLGPSRRRVKNFLHGTWLGHPLHPVLTDIPIGAWTVTLLLDSLDRGPDRPGLRRAADVSLALGLAGAVGSAITGLTDWSATDARPRRIGVAHALLNSGATLLFAASLFSRRRRRRFTGRGLALAGYFTAVAAGFLGGELVSHEQIGVDHSSGRELPEKFTAVLSAKALAQGKLKRVLYKETPLLLVRRGGRIHALAETCAHLGGPLSEGKLDGDCVVCPWHASKFALESGAVVEGPSAFPQPSLETRVRDGKIEVRVRRSGF
ncbi:MAG: Rieske 2Fe-2S domain-containing protein [Acidobacteriota bacterium]|nr:Rieske 2Fe-2S domain-containing protein [Acidobacteriota bacterium]